MDLAWLVERASTFGLVLARIAGLTASSPVFGGPLVPPPVRAAVALVLALVVLPVVPAATPVGAPAYLAALTLEVAAGLAVGLLSQLLFLAVHGAGELLDLDVGFGVGGLLAPDLERPPALLGGWLHVLALLVFLGVNAHHLVLRALLASFQAMPPGGPRLGSGGALGAARALGWAVDTALGLALPVLGVLALLTAALAVLGRLLPQLNVFLAGLPVKAVAGLLALGAGLPLLVPQLGRLARESLLPLLRWSGGGVP